VESGCLQFRVLGPFEVLRGSQPVGPAGAKRRGLLAMLVLRANSVVSADELIDGLWADRPPPSAANLVQTYVSAWRKALEPGRHGRGGGDRLVTAGPGYRLRVEPGELDLDQFARAVAGGQSAAAAGEHHVAAEGLAEALRLWHGPPLADLAGLPFHRAAADRLEELRLQAVEAWSVAALRTGHGQDVLAVVQEAREREPLREKLSELVMWALFQAGRQAEALAIYEQTRQLLADELGADPGAGLRDMHVRVLRQDPALCPSTMPPGAAPGSRQGLPVSADSFIGRDRELAEVCKLLEAHRLVTLTGPGGSGKTRLAIEVAAGLAAASAGRGVFFVDASPLPEAGLIPDRLARAMGVSPAPGQAATDALAHALAAGELLVVLDNLEHLPGAAPVVTQLLRAGPGLRLLVTSRTSLHARGEQLYPVPPLALPGPDAGPAAPAAAVALFADRAAAADPAFQLTTGNVGLVAEICRRLDGLPLAVELAASWLRVLPPTALLARLDRRLDLLAEVGGDRPGRQQTLRATIDWSYQLLAEPTRRTFCALAVFRGGWSLPAAAKVCGQADEVAVLGELAALTDASLIEPARAAAGIPWFRMLESLRDYALEQLTQRGEQGLCRDRHADYIHGLAADSAPQLTGQQQVTYLDRLEADRDNISGALRWLTATGQVERGLRTAALLWRFWHLRAHLEEGRALLEALLALAAGLDPVVHADGLAALGSVAYWQLDIATAERCYREALAHYTQAGRQAGIAQSHYDLGFTAVHAGASGRAHLYFSQALAEYEHLGDQIGRGNALGGLALVDRVTGNYERARQQALESLALQRKLGDEFGATNSLSLLGSITSRMGLLDDAEALLREALTTHERAGNVSGIIWMLHELADTAVSRRQPERAAMLSGAAQSLEGELGGGAGVRALGLTPPMQALPQQDDPAPAKRAWERGRLMTRQQAVAAALADEETPIRRPRAVPGSPQPPAPAGKTPTK
jgi:predicted ATPase/DNA-binding SARP family transcriptional activator